MSSLPVVHRDECKKHSKFGCRMDENCLYWETITPDNPVSSLNYQLSDVIPYYFASGHLLGHFSGLE